jgi:hypothetical protein
MEIKRTVVIVAGAIATAAVVSVLILSAPSPGPDATKVSPNRVARLERPVEPDRLNASVPRSEQASPATPPGLTRRAALGAEQGGGVDDVDDLVRSAVGALSSNSHLMTWLVSDGLAVRLVSAVEAVADGYSPRDELSFARPAMPFYVAHDGGQAVVTGATFRRYDAAAGAFASLDPAGVAAAYRRLLPRLEAIHDDLPYARGRFHDRVLEAIDQLLATPVPDGPYAVVRGVRGWAFADPDLESLSGAQRHLLRMGPRNARAVQATLATVRDAIEPPTSIRTAAARVVPDPDGSWRAVSPDPAR